MDKKILVVEDDAMLRNILKDQLHQAGYFVAVAKDGEEALSLIKSERPNVIVLDLLLPKVDGFQVLAELRAMPDPALASTPVLVVSNLGVAQSIELTKQYNVEEYYTKAEVSFGTIINRINRIFDKNAKAV